MIWRCPGCGAGFTSLQLYEVHANVCVPLHHGDSYRNKKQSTKEGKQRLTGAKEGERPDARLHNPDASTRRERSGERGRPKESPPARPA